MIRIQSKIISGILLTSAFMLTSCHSTRQAAKANYQIDKIEGSMICMDSHWDVHPDGKTVAILNPYKEKIDQMMYEVIGVSDTVMEKGAPESLLSNLVAEVLRQGAGTVLGKPADVGIINMGGLRNILPKGNITVGTVFEILPFENSLCVLTMKGADMKDLIQAIASVRGEGLSGIRMEVTKDGKLLNATIGGNPIEDEKLYTVGTIDYLADGNSHMNAFLQAVKRECPDGATLRQLFLDFVREQTAAGKTISSRLDGRVTVK